MTQMTQLIFSSSFVPLWRKKESCLALLKRIGGNGKPTFIFSLSVYERLSWIIVDMSRKFLAV